MLYLDATVLGSRVAKALFHLVKRSLTAVEVMSLQVGFVVSKSNGSGMTDE